MRKNSLAALKFVEQTDNNVRKSSLAQTVAAPSRRENPTQFIVKNSPIRKKRLLFFAAFQLESKYAQVEIGGVGSGVSVTQDVFAAFDLKITR